MTTSKKVLFWQRHIVSEQPKIMFLVGLIGVIVYAFARTGFPETAKLALNVSALLGFWALYKYGKIVNSHILFRFLWVVIALQIITWVLSVYYTPEWAEKNPRLDYLSRWLIFIPLAWWIAQSKNAIWLLWGSAALGVFISPWVTGYGLQEIIDGYYGKRVDLGLRNAQHTTMFFGMILIGLCCFGRSLIKIHKSFIIPITFFIAYSLFVVIASASRQSWLALVVTMVTISFFILHQLTKHYQLKLRLLSILLFFLVMTASFYMALSSDRISERINREHKTIEMLQNFDVKNMPYSSIGIRVHSWLNAFIYIKQKPIFGWGSNGQKIAMTKTRSWPENTIGTIAHLHSHYVATLMNFGITGIVFYFSIWIAIGRMLFREIQANRVEKEFGYFFSSIFIYWSVICFFESYLNMWTGIFVFNIFMAGIVGRIWHSKLHPVPTV
jgi:O-antigen ligase